MNPTYSFIAGLVASFTPCIIVLIPLVLYRFIGDKRDLKGLVLFSAGFIFSYLFFAILLSALFTSSVQDGLKLGLGLLFMTLGILSFIGRINPLNLPVLRNAFLTGVVFSLLVAASPCTLPYLGIIITLSYHELVLNLLVFSFGLLLPSLLFAFFGQQLLRMTRFSRKPMAMMSKAMSLILVVAGLYIAFSMQDIGIADIYVVTAMLSISFLLMLKAFHFLDSLNPAGLLLISGMVLILIAGIARCSTEVDAEQGMHENVCLARSECQECMTCLEFFATALLAGGVGTAAAHLLRKRFNSRTFRSEGQT